MENKTITQYYVEFYQYGASDEYIMQSRWFDTQEEAEQWYEESFDFINHGEIGADLMAAEWDDEKGYHNDIIVVKKF